MKWKGYSEMKIKIEHEIDKDFCQVYAIFKDPEFSYSTPANVLIHSLNEDEARELHKQLGEQLQDIELERSKENETYNLPSL